MKIEPSRGRAQPQGESDIVVGRYYYGINCPHCHEMTPLIENVNANIIGGKIWEIATDDVWEMNKMKHDSLQSKLSPSVKATMKEEPIEVTPTIMWADDMISKGAPYSDNNELNVLETREYLCVRAAKCYLKQANPGMHTEEIHDLTEQVFGGRFVKERTEDGVKRNPYKGLREITWRY